jgi:class 3 adenylate cyclase
MRCPSCGYDNPEGLKFCGECGTPLSARCPACGFANPPRFKFCGECGAPIEPASRIAGPPTTVPQAQSPSRYTPTYLAEKILTFKAALEGERKQVTVLFADLKGSMELLADRDPEEARHLLDPVLERMMGAVHRYEDTVNQVMGDRIMALFGAPIAREDHAVRACYAALAMQASVQQYAAEVQRTKGVPIQIRVNSGEVVVRSIGSDLRMDYTAVGQTTYLAARMQQMAMPESILITPEVLRMAEAVAHPRSLMSAYRGLGLLYLRQGDLPRALLLERAVRFSQDADFPSYFPRMAAALGVAYTLAGRIVDAVPLLMQAMDQTTASERVADEALCRLPLGEAHLRTGRPTEAHALAEDALAHAHAHQERGHQAYALCLFGEIATHRNPPETAQAEACYRLALTLADELGMHPLLAHCHRGLGTMYARLARLDSARTELSAAIDLYHTMEMTYWLPEAEAALARMEGR